MRGHGRIDYLLPWIQAKRDLRHFHPWSAQRTVRTTMRDFLYLALPWMLLGASVAIGLRWIL